MERHRQIVGNIFLQTHCRELCRSKEINAVEIINAGNESTKKMMRNNFLRCSMHPNYPVGYILHDYRVEIKYN